MVIIVTLIQPPCRGHLRCREPARDFTHCDFRSAGVKSSGKFAEMFGSRTVGKETAVLYEDPWTRVLVSRPGLFLLNYLGYPRSRCCTVVTRLAGTGFDPPPKRGAAPALPAGRIGPSMVDADECWQRWGRRVTCSSCAMSRMARAARRRMAAISSPGKAPSRRALDREGIA